MFRFNNLPRRHGFLFLFTLGCLLLVGWKADRPAKTGEKAPELSVLDLSGKTVKLADYRGKAVVLRFWASGCRACAAAMPILDKYARRYKERGLVVLAVNKGDSQETVEQFVRERKISYPVLLDPLSITLDKYGVSAVPKTFFIDRQGKVKMAVAGEMPWAAFEKTVEELL